MCGKDGMVGCLQWDQFLRNINIWIEAAVEIKEHAVHYQINTKF